MSDRQIVIARRNGAVRGPDGERIVIRAGRTVADADHPVVAAYPRAWTPVTVALTTPRGEGSDTAPDDQGDVGRAATVDPDIAEHADQFRRLATAARGLGVLPDEPLTAPEVVEHVVAILDEWKAAGQPNAEADGTVPAVDRETIRAWAKKQNMDVADVGRLPKTVEAAYYEAHGG
jgi:hypothetical protein